MAELLPGEVASAEGSTASGSDPAVSQGQSLASMLLDEVTMTSHTS